MSGFYDDLPIKHKESDEPFVLVSPKPTKHLALVGILAFWFLVSGVLWYWAANG